VEGILKCLEMLVRETLECYKQSSIIDSSGSSEDQNANRDADRKDHAYEVSNGNKDYIGNWIRDHSHYILAMNFG
jgi:hypothetical protein